MICQHCKKLAAKRPRQLCWGCCRDIGIRERYPSTSPKASAAARQSLDPTECVNGIHVNDVVKLPGCCILAIVVGFVDGEAKLEWYHDEDHSIDSSKKKTMQAKPEDLRIKWTGVEIDRDNRERENKQDKESGRKRKYYEANREQLRISRREYYRNLPPDRKERICNQQKESRRRIARAKAEASKEAA
jgi:hypothetical protein